MSSMAPRGKDETDAQYKARQVALGKFNEKMYGKNPVMTPTRPTMLKEPMPPKAPPTEVPMRGDVFLPTGERAPAKKPMVKTPMIEVPMRDVVFSPTGGKAPTKAATTAAKLAEPTIVKKATTAEKLAAPTPMKKAAGGAAKVRKGMMSPEGKILHAMNKVRGK